MQARIRFGRTHAQAAAHKLPPFLPGCTQLHRHHDKHENYQTGYIYTLHPLVLHLHKLSMSTLKARDAGITVWDHHGTKELLSPGAGRKLSPLTHHPRQSSPGPEGPSTLITPWAKHRGWTLAPHTSLQVLPLLPVGHTRPGRGKLTQAPRDT